MSEQLDRVVVVGGSLAGLRACETLRMEGFKGTITLVGKETERPYDRPPLSKNLLAGEWEPDRIRLRKPEDFDGLELDWRLGVTATALDPQGHTVTVSSDAGEETIAFDALVIATGVHPRRLPHQPTLDGLVELRTLADSLDLRTRLRGGESRVTVIGAGFIGLEVAATARRLGCEVTVLEGAVAPLMRGLGAAMGADVAAVHRRHGVDLRCAVHVAAIEGSGGRATGVRLGDGELVGSDVIVVGVGVAPATEWLTASGLELHDGVVCDATLRAADGIYAAGDCARWHNTLFDPHDDAVMRVEHWTNAAEQGAAAAHNLLAVARGEEPTAYDAVPFFWSDQYESRIQFLGRAHGGDEIHVFGGQTDGPFAALYGFAGRLRGVLGVSKPKLVMPFRCLLADRVSWDDALVKAGEVAG